MVAVLFVDLDRFKLVNDGLGHETGDELLVAVSRRLSATVRRQDTIARFGGDEFVVLCEDLAATSARRSSWPSAPRSAFVEPFALSRAEVTVSASIGIAVTNRSSDRAVEPAAGRRRGDVPRQAARRRPPRAVRRGDAHPGGLPAAHRARPPAGARPRRAARAVPAAVRPRHRPTGSRSRRCCAGTTRCGASCCPATSCASPRRPASSCPIGEWVLERACDAAAVAPRRRAAATTRLLTVSTNVSARQLQRPDFPAARRARVARLRASTRPSLCLEVAESALLDDLDTTADALRALKDLGVQLAIDDFGTGGSSLTYLRRFPFDELKIDRMFVEGLGRSAADDAIVAATIDMAHALGMVVAAEGVETEEQRLRLVELGCDRAQGYHLGAPEELATPRDSCSCEQRPA